MQSAVRHLGPRGKVAARAGLAAAGAWLLYPALSPAHVEGFSASIVSLGLHLGGGDLSAYDQLHPANLQFFGLSRLGTALSVTLFSALPGVSGDWAMRATMWVAFAVLAWASFVLVRRWTGAGAVVAAASLLLMPGVAESAFFYNDNVLSSALAVASLAVVASSQRLVLTAPAGLLFGAAMVARFDAVLLAPAVPLIAYGQHGLGRTFLLRAVVFAAGVLVPLVGVLGAFHSTFLDVLEISGHVTLLWERGLSGKRHLHEVAVFVGLPAGVLVALGLRQLARRREYLPLLLLAGVPLLFNLVYLAELWQSRQLLPLTPFFAALAARGWQGLAPHAVPPRFAAARAAFVALALAVSLAPPLWVRPDDGPRAMLGLGRAWTPPLWTRWQAAVRANIRDIGVFASGVSAARPAALLTDTWDGDRYLHLALQDSGFAAVPAARTPPACGKTAELFRKGDRYVLHVRLHDPFLAGWKLLLPARLETYGIPCLAAVRPSATFLLSPVDRVEELLGPGVRANPWIARERANPAARRTGYHPQAAVPLTPSRMARLRLRYRRDAAGARGELTRPIDLPEAERLLSSQVPFPDGRQP